MHIQGMGLFEDFPDPSVMFGSDGGSWENSDYEWIDSGTYIPDYTIPGIGTGVINSPPVAAGTTDDWGGMFRSLLNTSISTWGQVKQAEYNAERAAAAARAPTVQRRPTGSSQLLTLSESERGGVGPMGISPATWAIGGVLLVAGIVALRNRR